MVTIDEKVAHQIVCLRNIANVLSHSESDIEEVLNTLVHLVPEGWQFSEDAACRIVYENIQAISANYKETPWVQSAAIYSEGKQIAIIEIRYLSKKPDADEGPFLLLERNLLDIIASELSSYFERKKMEMIKDRQHRELDLYASLLRHDLRNDVGVVLGNVDAMRMLLSDRGEIAEELLVSTEAVCERMLSLLTTFGSSAKILEKNIVALVRVSTKQAQEANMNLRVIINVARGAKKLAVPESALLPLVFDNLLRNASIHAGEKPTVNISIRRKDCQACIVVQDDGPGVTEEMRAKLFTRGGSSRSGGGLGLYLSKRVVEVLGGSMDFIDTPEGSGAAFRILLPLV
jgi:signal transduction histidine kinase